MEISLPKTNLYNELLKVKGKSSIINKNPFFEFEYNISKIDSNKLFHVNQIKKICIDYRLRFLELNLFKGKVPKKAYQNLEKFKADHPNLKFDLKIMAPSKLFELENYDDPLLFASLGNGYYYLIHKWGNDLSFFRKISVWPFKNLVNILTFISIISLVITALVPGNIFYYDGKPGTQFFITFLFILKSVIAIFIYYGFSLGKNFNEFIWNRKYFN
ncbi:hypothetical protein OA327_01555 [Flavobacteriales bacterium]|nr:hypothetical protein [Flavobacteriales bacterium]|tara:strand:+ start:705 stop:1352 length:648 start_codon:yes stop_codon:yes gene_type:complete